MGAAKGKQSDTEALCQTPPPPKPPPSHVMDLLTPGYSRCDALNRQLFLHPSPVSRKILPLPLP